MQGSRPRLVSGSKDSGWERFPPRLAWQPIFYPVLAEDYAVMIARDRNTKDDTSGFVDYVLRFRVMKSYLDRHQPHGYGPDFLAGATASWCSTARLIATRAPCRA